MRIFCKIKYLFVILLLFLVPIKKVNATYVNYIDMDIFVDEYGNATVVEKWDIFVNDGTELFHPYEYLENSIISDLEVMMDGQEYDIIYNWNNSGSLEEKAYKAVIDNGDSINIKFGVSSYGSHKYKLTYRISNFVMTTNDADMIFFNLLPSYFEYMPLNVYVTIYSDFAYEDSLMVLNRGMFGEGSSYVKNGKIEIIGENVLDSVIAKKQYLTVLVKFPKGTFKTSNMLKNNFDYYYKKFEEGEVNYNDNNEWLETLIPVGLISFLLLLMLFAFRYAKNNKCFFGKVGNKVIDDVPLINDISQGVDVFYVFWVIYYYKLNNDCYSDYFPKVKEDFLNIILIKWLYEGNIRVENTSGIVFLKRPIGVMECELKIYDYMQQASKDGKLQIDEFRRWCYSNYSRIFDWFNDVLYKETLVLVNKGKITLSKKKMLGLISYNSFEVDGSMMVEAEKTLGLKKFLVEFVSNGNHDSKFSVNLWYEYLIYAYFFGLFDDVFNKFKDLYPNIEDYMKNFDYNDIMFIRSVSASGIEQARKAMIRVNKLARRVSRL